MTYCTRCGAPLGNRIKCGKCGAGRYRLTQNWKTEEHPLVWVAALFVVATTIIALFVPGPLLWFAGGARRKKSLLEEAAPQQVFDSCSRASGVVATAAIARSQGKSERQALNEAFRDNKVLAWGNDPALVSHLVHWVYQSPTTDHEAGDYIESCLISRGYDPAITKRKLWTGGYDLTPFWKRNSAAATRRNRISSK